MKSNYNDIIDIILTLIEDDKIAKNIVISGSIVPYIAIKKESFEYHSDFYILVKYKKINEVRKKILDLSREYEFDVISDSKKISGHEYGFKIKYEDTTVGFFPYSIIDNEFIIRSYSLNKELTKISLKEKKIPRVSKSSVIKLIRFNSDKNLRILSPEYILADKEAKEKQVGNPSEETMQILNKISDYDVLSALRDSIKNEEVKISTQDVKKYNDKIITIILAIILISLLLIAYICFKK